MTNERLLRDRTSDLKDRLTARIASEKAYNVPSYCVALGLAEGEEQEAWASKARYASQRLNGQSREVLIAAGERALLDGADFELEEALNKLKEIDNTITPITRRRLLDIFSKLSLSTEVLEIELIRSIWPIEKMFPNIDYGVPYDPFDDRLTMDSVLWYQMVQKDRWGAREALEALGWMEVSEALVFRVLETAVSPLHRKAGEVDEIVATINQVLKHDDLRLAAVGKMSGSPIYRISPLQSGSPADPFISEVLKSYDADTIHKRWETALERRSADPEGAITLARTLLEDVCRWILDESGDASVKDQDDLSKIYSKLAKILNLAPDAHAEQVFKQILGSCQQIVEQLGALRNRISDAHSPGPRKVKPKARHAELAVNLSGAMALFLISTWKDKQVQDGGPNTQHHAEMQDTE